MHVGFFSLTIFQSCGLLFLFYVVSSFKLRRYSSLPSVGYLVCAFVFDRELLSSYVFCWLPLNLYICSVNDQQQQQQNTDTTSTGRDCH